MSVEKLKEAVKPCEIEGTSLTESGVKVSVKPDKRLGEEILFFCIDPESNENCGFIDVIAVIQICDLLIQYESSSVKLLFCLVELKGRDVDHAIGQVLSTFKGILKTFGRSVRNEAKWKAYIVQHGSAPSQVKSRKTQILKAEAENTFDDFDIKKAWDIGPFLRR